jgi:hypothetical protein
MWPKFSDGWYVCRTTCSRYRSEDRHSYFLAQRRRAKTVNRRREHSVSIASGLDSPVDQIKFRHQTLRVSGFARARARGLHAGQTPETLNRVRRETGATRATREEKSHKNTKTPKNDDDEQANWHCCRSISRGCGQRCRCYGTYPRQLRIGDQGQDRPRQISCPMVRPLQGSSGPPPPGSVVAWLAS